MESNVQQAPKTRLKKRETISELAHRHLHDRSHVTTDEELRNVQVVLGSGYDDSSEYDYDESGQDAKPKNIAATPWDVTT